MGGAFGRKPVFPAYVEMRPFWVGNGLHMSSTEESGPAKRALDEEKLAVERTSTSEKRGHGHEAECAAPGL